MSDQYGAGPGYTPMPGEPPRGPAVRGTAPPSVITAVRLMLTGAALSVLGIIVLVATKDTLKKEIAKRNTGYSPQKLDDALNAFIVLTVVIAIIIVVLYVLLAFQVRKGKNWARIVTWVLAGLGVLAGLASFAQPEPALSRVLTIVGALIDVGIIVLLAGKPANEYFRRVS